MYGTSEALRVETVNLLGDLVVEAEATPPQNERHVSPLKIGTKFNRKYIFQPLIFMGHVSFLGSICYRSPNKLSRKKPMTDRMLTKQLCFDSFFRVFRSQLSRPRFGLKGGLFLVEISRSRWQLRRRHEISTSLDRLAS